MQKVIAEKRQELSEATTLRIITPVEPSGALFTRLDPWRKSGGALAGPRKLVLTASSEAGIGSGPRRAGPCGNGFEVSFKL